MKFIFLEVCRIDRRSRCWFRWRRRKLTCRTAKPGFEACLAKLGRIARHDTALAQLGAEVACLWICKDLARIVKCAESLPDEFVETKHVRSGNFNFAVQR